MPRSTGLPKTGGRTLGTPNKKTQVLIERLEALDCDPIEGLVRIAQDEKISTELRVRCYAELAQYVYPKRKAVDVQANQPTEQTQIKVVFCESPHKS